MTTTPSFKNISTTDMENALAQTIAKLTGWAHVKVSVDNVQFGVAQSTIREQVSLQMRVDMESEKDDGMPF